MYPICDRLMLAQDPNRMLLPFVLIEAGISGLSGGDPQAGEGGRAISDRRNSVLVTRFYVFPIPRPVDYDLASDESILAGTFESVPFVAS